MSSRRVSPSPAGPESSAPTGVRPEELKDLLERASILEDHRTLMGTVIERISSAESGIVAPETRYVVKSDGVPRIIISVIRCRPSYLGGGSFGGQPD